MTASSYPVPRDRLASRHGLARSLAAWAFIATGISHAHATESSASTDRPNIVVFLVDDLGWQDTSVPFGPRPTPFNAHYDTPHMEAMAERGVKFSQAYACAVCSPSRTSVMTGFNATRHHVTQWTLFAGRDQSGKTARLQSPPNWRTDGLQPGERTLAGLLQGAGYRTIHVGKAHWGANGTPGCDPTTLGFDVNVAGHAAGGPGSHSGLDGFGAHKPTWAIPGLAPYHGLAVNITDALTAEANREVARAVADDVPFFLHLAHYTVHAPIEPHEPYAQPYRDRGVDEREARYASMVKGMDQSLGSVMAQLEQLGVAEQTLVLFLSDNGGLSAHARGTTPTGTGLNTHNRPLKAGKGSAYEGGTRIPQIVAWAKRQADHPLQQALEVEAGATRHTPTMIEDVFPTLLTWADLEAPSDIDGEDFTPLLTGEAPDLGAERPLVFHYPHVWGPKGPGYEPHSAMRLGDWKVIYFYEPQRWELYNLATDLSEDRNLADEQPEVLRRMATRLLEELTTRDAQYPALRTSGDPEPPVLPSR